MVTREVRDRTTGAVLVDADYSGLGWLLITVAAIGVIVPLLTILIIQGSPLRTRDSALPFATGQAGFDRDAKQLTCQG